MIYLELFWEFFKAGLFAVGGGMATLPFLREMGARKGWFDSGALADMLAVSESTPGPVGINMATYVGWRVGSADGGAGGILGAVVATLGEVAPSILIILIIAAFLNKFRGNRFVDAAFYGIRPASTALIAAAGIGVMLLCLVNVPAWTAGGAFAELFVWKGLALFAALLVLTNFVKPVKDWHPIVFIALSAAAGIVFEF